MTFSQVKYTGRTGKNNNPFLGAKGMVVSPFFKPAVQRKLRNTGSGDMYEREANKKAEQVVHSSSGSGYFFKAAANLHPLAQRKCSHCEAEGIVQKQAEKDDIFSASAIPGVLSSTGHKMDSETEAFMELGFKYNFGNVQIHNDTIANQSSSQINALAYTHGNHIVFGEGQYQPNTVEGKKLLAHELTHVIQQDTQPGVLAGGIQMQEDLNNNEPDIVDMGGQVAMSLIRSAVCAVSGWTSQPLIDPMADISTFQSPGASGWLGAKFGCYRNGCQRRHQGWDIHASAGTPVLAVVAGNTRKHFDAGGYGNYVDLATDADPQIVYRYAHLSAWQPNGHYCPGDKIGDSGVTGNASADRPHLHMQVIVRGTAADPIRFFTEPSRVIEQVGTAASVINKTLPGPCAPC